MQIPPLILIFAFFLLTAKSSNILGKAEYKKILKQAQLRARTTKPKAPVVSVTKKHSHSRHKVLGGGSMGNVFKVKRADDSVVAVKVIPKAALVGRKMKRWTEYVKYLVACEIRALHRLSKCPHVINLYDIHEDNGNVYLSLEFCDYGTLGDLIYNDYTATPEVAFLVTKQLVKGLMSIHHFKIVHCDIKPTNILIMSDGALKYADFGGSILMDAPRNTHMTMADNDEDSFQSYWGTPLYQAPEVMEGREPNELSDIWSLGMTLFEFLAGQLPYGDDYQSSKELFLAINSLPPQDLPKKYANLNQKVMKMIDLSPEERILPATNEQPNDDETNQQRQFAASLNTPPTDGSDEAHISTWDVPDNYISHIRDFPDIQADGIKVIVGAPFPFKSDNSSSPGYQ